MFSEIKFNWQNFKIHWKSIAPRGTLILLPLPILTVVILNEIANQCDLDYIKYRDRTALFGKELKPGEKPSWPKTLARKWNND